MGGGGGGGGDEIAAQNAKEEADKKKGLQQLKILFGLSNALQDIGPAPVAPTIPVINGMKAILTPAEFAKLQKAQQGSYSKVGSGYRLSSATSRPTGLSLQPGATEPAPNPLASYDTALAKYQTDLSAYKNAQTNQQSGSKNATLLNKNVTDQEKAVSNYLTPQHDRQLQETQLRTTDRLAAQGLSGSSVDVEERDKLNFTDQQGRRAIAARAKNAGQQMRSRLMTAYSELARQIAAGGGYDATSALTARNSAATTQAAEEPWQNLFTNAGLLADLQAPAAYANTMAQLRKSSTSPGSVSSGSSSGTITRY